MNHALAPLLILVLTDAALAQDAPPTPPAPGLTIEVPVKPALRPLDEDLTAANLLDHLEVKDADIDQLSATVQYTRVQALQGDTQTRFGTLYYRHGDAANGSARQFAVDFTKLIVDNTRRDERSVWIFDGEWLVEKDYQTKQFVRRRIAAPGENVDPLRLGSGSKTIPLPIGQRREDVEKYFVAELVSALDGLVPGPDAIEDDDEPYRDFVRQMGGETGVEGVYQLKLTPREGTDAAEDYRVIRLWYQKGTLIPMMSRAIGRSGDISTVQLVKVNTTDPLPAGVADTSPPPGGEGWDIREEDRLFE